MSVAILVPVLGRPNRVKPLLASIEAATAPPFSVVFLCDSRDTEEIAAVHAALRPGVRLLIVDGPYARKINEGVRLTTEPLIFTGADDLNFHPFWLERARDAMARHGVSVVGVNDLMRRRRPRHATHFVLAREYAERPCIDGTRGPMFEGYDHSFCDDELIATASHRGEYIYAEDVIVEHRHWMRGAAERVEDDETYRKGRLMFHEDRRTFRARSHLWT